MAFNVRRTEHAGAKNGGGHRGTRAEAKQQSDRLRRRESRELEAVDWTDDVWADYEARGFLPPHPNVSP